MIAKLTKRELASLKIADIRHQNEVLRAAAETFINEVLRLEASVATKKYVGRISTPEAWKVLEGCWSKTYSQPSPYAVGNSQPSPYAVGRDATRIARQVIFDVLGKNPTLTGPSTPASTKKRKRGRA